MQDCTKAEDALETKLQDIRGEILEMLMEGTEGSRTCTLSVVIPADKFRVFIADLRGMGKIQHRGMGTMEQDCKSAIEKPWK